MESKTQTLKLQTFASALLLLVLGLFILDGLKPSVSPFKSGNNVQLSLLDTLPAADVINIKINHAIISPKAKVGLFGDSRSVQVSSKDIGLKNGEFFNFAVPGTSFRQSSIYLEQLSKIGKVPEIALVNFDNFELQYFPNPTHPTAPMRWAYVWEDVSFGAKHSTLVDTLKIVKRALIVEWEAIIRFFNYELIVGRLQFALSDNDPAMAEAPFLTDGSRRQRSPSKKVVISNNFFANAKPNILLDFMKRDLARLSGLEARVVVYESPIHPDLAKKLLKQPSQYAHATRKRFLKACKNFKIECYTGPVLEKGNNLWVDNSHAPGPILGAYLAQILRSERVE